jgi:hypothetical protein
LKALRLHTPPRPGIEFPVEVLVPGRYTVRAWTEAEWGALPERDRPGAARPVPGFGWAVYDLTVRYA